MVTHGFFYSMQLSQPPWQSRSSFRECSFKLKPSRHSPPPNPKVVEHRDGCRNGGVVQPTARLVRLLRRSVAPETTHVEPLNHCALRSPPRRPAFRALL